MFKHHLSSVLARCLAIALPLTFSAAAAAWAQISLPPCSGNLPQFSVCEIVLTANATGNRYPDTEVTATFTLAGTSTVKTVKGFFDGNAAGNRAIFRIRFNVSHLNGSSPGSWSYTTSSTDLGLNGRTGNFTAVASGNRGFLRRASSGTPEKFVFDSGARFFMWGQTYYQIVTNVRGNGGWQQAVTESLGRNLTKVRMLLYPFEITDGPYLDSQPFTDAGHTTLDLTHWRKFDEAVKLMNDQGMISDVILFNDQARTFASPLGTPAGRAMDKRYVRYAMARYAAFPNVIWCLTNEWDLSAAPYNTDKAYWTDLGTTIRNEDPWMNQSARQRPLSIHGRPNHSFKFFTDAWPVYAVVQDGIRNGGICPPSLGTTANPHFNNGDEWGNYSICNNLGHGMPVANDEYGYINAMNCGPSYPLTREQHRRVVWGIAVAGGYGSAGDATKGVTPMGQPFFWGDWADEPEYGDISRMVRFFTGRVATWWLMSRDAAVVSATGCAPTVNRVYALSQPGVRYVVYAAKGGTFNLNLPAPSGAATYKVYRINPRTYDPITSPETPLSNVGGGTRSFTMPDSQDWVLLIEV